MMKSLPWHHVHITIPDRETAARWHEQHTPAKRGQPTKRSENLFNGPNLLQIQSKAVASKSREGCIISIGIGVSDISKAVADWLSAGGSLVTRTDRTARVQDPWGVPFELVGRYTIGYTHINIETAVPEKLRDWYESNLGGERVPCEWDNTRLALMYDTILVVFESRKLSISPTEEQLIDHIGWYTNDLDSVFLQLSANGVNFPVKPMRFGLVRLAQAMDPCGSWIELNASQEGISWKQNLKKK